MTTSIDVCREKLISITRRIISESGNPMGFDAASWVDKWLDELVPALGTTPREYILAGHDCEVLVNLLRQMQSGSFS